MNLVVGEVYLTKRIGEAYVHSTPNYRKYFGEGKWGIGWTHPESAASSQTFHFSNTNNMMVVQETPKKERRCLNPA
jgi:hypothetical protein